MPERAIDPQAIHDELERARADLHRMVVAATPASLRRASDGTRWTNEQLLFHMLFGTLIVRTLIPLVRFLARLPGPVSSGFARLLDAASTPFHIVNYLGSCGGALVFNHDRMGRRLDRTIAALRRRLATESPASLQRSACFPPRWDPCFRDVMTLAEVYHYATQHVDAHARQLTL